MLKPVKTKTVSIINHVHRNRGKYIAAGVASAFIYVQFRASQQWTEFMKEKGIDPMEFFNPEYFAELNPQ